MAVFLGGLITFLLVALLVVVIRRSRTKPQADVSSRVEALRELSRPVHITGLAAMLRELTDHVAPGKTPWPERARAEMRIDGGLLTELERSLYSRQPAVSAKELEQAVLTAARRAGF